MFQPRYARLEDAFDDIDIKTDEGDIDDGFDYEGEEVGINVIMKTNRFVKNIYFVFNSSQTMGKIVFRSRDSTSRPCGRLSRTEWCLVRSVACCGGRLLCAGCTVPARRRRSCCQPAGKMSYLQINQRKIMKILANKHKLHGENFHQLIFTVVHNNLIVHYAFTHY